MYIHVSTDKTSLKQSSDITNSDDNFGTNYVEKCRQMEPGGHFCHLTMRPRMEMAQGRPIGTATKYQMMYLAIPPSCFPLATKQWKRKKMIQAGLTRRHPLAAKIPAKLRILNKGRA